MLVPYYKELSGHYYRNASHESADDCGNCDGANCDLCEVQYHFWHTLFVAFSVDEAEEYIEFGDYYTQLEERVRFARGDRDEIAVIEQAMRELEEYMSEPL